MLISQLTRKELNECSSKMEAHRKMKMLPYITDFKEIIDKSIDYINEYGLENLNLRGEHKNKILFYIQENYPNLIDRYNDIYINRNIKYWIDLSRDIEDYCHKIKVKYKKSFYHKELVKEKNKKFKSIMPLKLLEIYGLIN